MALLTLSTTRLTLRCKAKRRLEGEVQMELETHRWSTAPSFLRPPDPSRRPCGPPQDEDRENKKPRRSGVFR
ncbi:MULTISPECIES: hypothetical protein [Brucella]|uniref:Uncharacterized protein n=13 Tax=Brucella TaxID=234 RepID=Q2YPK7_BRUA2|nr:MULTISPECIES: hypothetical protein [Brucella]AAL52768.1 hypothetical protein BMEI1587 [Brucella melitensis bv. 1 str. 16M]AAN29285.1 hypothetical protein BR0336 [Brucella suis 1330]AAX73761.1 hypothetical protein BruAb1_0362 [Brucella abortus bv. 1 str. 9-941]ABX61435.1 Hypothetical protein, conserved [Brucella canis ATCC 23365]ABY37458.1 Hypothetical protein, conserved [Brucella suis ATCC 23445]